MLLSVGVCICMHVHASVGKNTGSCKHCLYAYAALWWQLRSWHFGWVLIFGVLYLLALAAAASLEGETDCRPGSNFAENRYSSKNRYFLKKNRYFCTKNRYFYIENRHFFSNIRNRHSQGEKKDRYSMKIDINRYFSAFAWEVLKKKIDTGNSHSK